MTSDPSQEVPLLNAVSAVDGKMTYAGNMAAMGGMSTMMGGAEGMMRQEYITSTSSMGGGGGYYDGALTQEGGYGGGAWGMGHSADYAEFESREALGVYDGIALPEHFLGQYYTQVRKQLTNCSTLKVLFTDFSTFPHPKDGRGWGGGGVGVGSVAYSNFGLGLIHFHFNQS